MLCDEMKEHTSQILIPHERVIILVFRCQKRLVGVVPFDRKFALKVTQPPLKKSRLRPMSAYNISTVRISEKCSLIANRKSTTRFQRGIDKVRTLPSTRPKGGSKSEFVVFVNKIQVQSNKVC